MQSNNFGKRKKINVLMSFIAISCLITISAKAQCSSDDFMDKCATGLGGANFIKSYEIEAGKASEEKPNQFSYVFSKGSMYTIVICDQNVNGNRLIVNLYDRNKKIIASNYVKSSKKIYPSISYPCNATGVYYIESFFQGEKPATCGVNIIGFSKQ